MLVAPSFNDPFLGGVDVGEKYRGWWDYRGGQASMTCVWASPWRGMGGNVTLTQRIPRGWWINTHSAVDGNKMVEIITRALLRIVIFLGQAILAQSSLHHLGVKP